MEDAARAAAQADRAGGETFPAPGVRSSEYVVRDLEGALFTVAEETGD